MSIETGIIKLWVCVLSNIFVIIEKINKAYLLTHQQPAIILFIFKKTKNLISEILTKSNIVLLTRRAIIPTSGRKKSQIMCAGLSNLCINN